MRYLCKYRKVNNPNMSFIHFKKKKKKKCKFEDVKIVKGDESVEILKILGLIENI